MLARKLSPDRGREALLHERMLSEILLKVGVFSRLLRRLAFDGNPYFIVDADDIDLVLRTIGITRVL